MHPVTTTLCTGEPNSKGGWFHSVPREKEEEEGGRGEPNARYMYVPDQG